MSVHIHMLTVDVRRIHNKPTFSQTIVLQNLYINPQNSAKSADGSHLTNVSDEEMQVTSSYMM